MPCKPHHEMEPPTHSLSFALPLTLTHSLAVRASAKLVHTMRHAAAKAVGDLGLAAAGLVRVRGWYAAAPDWQERYALNPAELHRMPDTDPRTCGDLLRGGRGRRGSV